MNIDLLPPSFAHDAKPLPDYTCGECASWREHFQYSGWCLMYTRPRGACQTPDNIGGRTLWISCFSPAHQIGALTRYGSVTRTVNDKSVVFSSSDHG